MFNMNKVKELRNENNRLRAGIRVLTTTLEGLHKDHIDSKELSDKMIVKLCDIIDSLDDGEEL